MENEVKNVLCEHLISDIVGVRSRNGKNRTLRHREWSQRSEFTMFNTLVLAPNVVSGEIDVFPVGYRIYDQAAVKRLRFIKQAQTLGFSLDEIRRIFEPSWARQRNLSRCYRDDRNHARRNRG